MRAFLIGFTMLVAVLLTPHEVKAQAIILPCVPSGTSCIPVSAANPLPVTNAGGSTFPPAGCVTANGVIFNNATPCDTGFTYAGAGGQVAFTGTLAYPTGSAAANSIQLSGTAGTGITSTSPANLILSVGGTAQGTFTAGSLAVNGNVNSTSVTGLFEINSDVAISRVAANSLRFGFFDAAAPAAQTLNVPNVTSGTSNVGGANWTMNASKSTGTGVGGKIIMQTTVTGLTGTTVNSNFPMLTLNPGGATTSTVQFGDGTNITTYDGCTGFTSSATGVLACTASAMRFKDMFPAQALNLIGLDNLRTDIPWKYRDDAGFGLDTKRVHVGLFADDVESLDSRCVVYEQDGKVKDYEDRCVIAYLVADRQKMKAEIEALKRRSN